MLKIIRTWVVRAREEEGITGLETAIILIAFVVVATVFAFVVLTTGVFSSERGKETVFAGLEKARGTMEMRGGVVVTATGLTLVVDDIQFTVATTAGGAPIPLDPLSTTNRTVLAYRDDNTVDNDVAYTVTSVVGDGGMGIEFKWAGGGSHGIDGDSADSLYSIRSWATKLSVTGPPK